MEFDLFLRYLLIKYRQNSLFGLHEFQAFFLDFQLLVQDNFLDLLKIRAFRLRLVLLEVPMIRINGYAQTLIFSFSVFGHTEH